jgi:cold shock CspA family protein
MASDERIEKLVAKELGKLERFFSRLITCRVVVEAPPKPGGLHNVRIEAVSPKKDVVVSNTPSLHASVRSRGAETKTKKWEVRREFRDPRRAVHDTFKELRRRLQDHSRKMNLAVKHHAPLAAGRVTKLLPSDGYGYIETAGGREIYFHKNSVLNDHFSELCVGSKVRFAEEAGNKGPQASTVQPMGRRSRSAAEGESVPVVPAKRKLPTSRRAASAGPK